MVDDKGVGELCAQDKNNNQCHMAILMGMIIGLSACNELPKTAAEFDNNTRFTAAAQINNVPNHPIAEAGDDQLLSAAPMRIELDGQASQAPDGGVLTYQWTLLSRPAASQVNLQNSTTVQASFEADVEGSYLVQLVVSTSAGESIPDLVTITTHANGGLACQDCHDGGLSTAKPELHIVTNDNCSVCHSSEVWVPIDTLAHHAIPEACEHCHDNSTATGKAETHMVTDRDCNYCHMDNMWKFARWEPVTPVFEHKGIVAGCADCHGPSASDQSLPGKFPQHPVTSDRCDNCHTVYSWVPQLRLEHVEAMADCGLCHDNVMATGPAMEHIDMTAECKVCHIKTAWIPAVNPETLVSGCPKCHNNTILEAQPAFHIKTLNQQCEMCHQLGDPNSWRGALQTLSHNRLSGECARCHNGTLATGVGPTHMATSPRCEACHAISVFIPTRLIDHAEVLGACTSCHTQSAQHQATDPDFDCDSCHLVSSWLEQKINHAAVINTCVSCHDGITAVGKQVGHIESADVCDACHGTSVFAPTVVIDHEQVQGECINCHDGSVARGKKDGHISTTDNCEACHSVNIFSLVIAVDHNEVQSECAVCHNNFVARGQPPTHISTGLVCDACHATLQWSPADRIDHQQVLGDCVACHNDVNATGQPPTHLSTTDNCSACHSTQIWIPVNLVDHAELLEASNCIGCHDGVKFVGQPPTHIATTTDNCDACHSTATWLPVVAVDHAQLDGQRCETCHSPPQSHVVTGRVNNCKLCHTTVYWRK